MQRDGQAIVPGGKLAALANKTQFHNCVEIVHMFSPATVNLSKEPQFFDELQTETTAEAQKFGTVLQCHVSRISPDGRVYLKFQTAEMAQKCRKAFDQRWFDGRQLKVACIPDSTFNTALLKTNRFTGGTAVLP